jgi:hypothetical protein
VHHAHPIIRLEVVLAAFADEEERGFASLGPVRLGRQLGVLPDFGPSDRQTMTDVARDYKLRLDEDSGAHGVVRSASF